VTTDATRKTPSNRPPPKPAVVCHPLFANDGGNTRTATMVAITADRNGTRSLLRSISKSLPRAS
jgi:hypothetical protein